MPSPTYSRLLQVVSGYIDAATAKEILDRQLSGGGCLPDTFTVADLRKVLLAVNTATKLYVPDKGKREEMVQKIQTLAV